ncbi:MAG: sigma-E factor negative regulatory protein RseC [Halioglobus sp.]|jgi:sigma-E factor negative regulatory protein RseC
MLTETGRVVAVDDRGLWVETIRQSTCGTCAAQKGCGHGILNTLSEGKRGYIHVLPGEVATQDYGIDDEVLISIPEEVILRGSFIAYLLPLLTMLAGAVLGVDLIPLGADGASALGAVIGLCAGFALVRWHAVTHQSDPSFQPILLQVLKTPVATVSFV